MRLLNVLFASFHEMLISLFALSIFVRMVGSSSNCREFHQIVLFSSWRGDMRCTTILDL